MILKAAQIKINIILKAAQNKINIIMKAAQNQYYFEGSPDGRKAQRF